MDWMQGWGRLRSVHLTDIANAVRTQDYWDTLHKQKHLAQKMNIRTCILHNDLHLGAYWHSASHLQNTRLKEQRFLRCKKQLKRVLKNRQRDILFTDEEIFCIRDIVNRQNDRALVKNCYKAEKRVSGVQRGHRLASVTEIHFHQAGGKTNLRCTAACRAQLLSHSMICCKMCQNNFSVTYWQN